ncbi:MAG: ATP-grasp domain-containing protein [Methanobacteriaceae archaeon]|jgi:carbamoylphosphate synthase large subunit|nr:ATP-grasp domain-containing protein [Candidatus Methanorudis spinitermitis]
MKILFIGARLFDDIFFYLREKGIKSILTESNKNSPNLELADQTFMVPRGMEKPMKIAIFEKVDGVIPLIGIDIPLKDVAIMKKELESKYDIPVIASNIRAVDVSSDKIKTKKFFKENYIDTPDYFLANDFKELFERIQNGSFKLDFPIVLKQSIGQGGKNIKIAKNLEELKEYSFEFDNALCEEYIEGSEISIEVLSYKKENKQEILPLTPVYKGETTIEGIHPLNKLRFAPCEIEGLNNNHVRKIATKIAKKLDCEGTIDIDFIYSKKYQKLYTIEINTRPSGTRYLTAATSGINPLIKLIDMVTGEFNSNLIKKEMKNYFALEIPIGNYKGGKIDEPLKKFTKNSFVVHGPRDYERITISGESKKIVNKIANKIVGDNF